ncbi:uncharacterized protein LOC122085615 [Macadamia integrifolia]|uniref:uncharacterized protein LOC122085615 n=1 Tax=Macadamia integrifolia TaxID=60698 RepID=UPI001C4FE339|nr:uncharacterized protein LOC122085615 [Macadamia integrifolia]
MGKIRVEVCLISARGLRRSSSLWKLQWFAVGWIEPKNKYCTKIDASGNANPTWKTKFSVLIDDSEPTNLEGLTLQVEVYSREPIFLREKLQGTATILLKEFLAKYSRGSGVSKQGGIEEVGSFQLRQQKSSGKPQGFVDVCIRISEDRGGVVPYTGEGERDGYGKGEGILLEDHSNTIPVSMEYGPTRPYPPQPYPQMNVPYAHPMPFPGNYQNQSPMGEPSYPSAGGPSYRPPTTPPPPPPPSHVGYLPTFLPRTDPLPETYVNMPSSVSGTSRAGRPNNFAMGAGAGALAAGAVIFGDDFMSGFDFPSGLQDASLTVSTDPPF